MCQVENMEVYSQRLSFPSYILTFFPPVAEPSCRSSISSKQLGQLTETLLSIFNSRSFSEQTINACMDRSGFHEIFIFIFINLRYSSGFCWFGLFGSSVSLERDTTAIGGFAYLSGIVLLFLSNHCSRYRFDTRNLAPKTK